MNWSRRFTRPVLAAATGNPNAVLELLCRHAEAHPEALPVFEAALREFATWHPPAAEGLGAVLSVRRALAPAK